MPSLKSARCSPMGPMLLLAALILLLVNRNICKLVSAGYHEETIFPTTTPAPHIRSLLNSTSQPAWFTYCQDPPNPHERLITVILGPQTFQPQQLIDMVQREAGKFVASLNLPKRPQVPGVSRRKRSMGVYANDNNSINKAAILFKKPRYKHKVATKKTSFAAWSPAAAQTSQKWHHHGPRYFVEPGAEVIVAPSAQPSNNDTKLVETLVADNIRLSWSFNCALNTCRLPKRAANELREELARGLDERKITQGDLDEAERRRSKWWPNINSLIVRSAGSAEAPAVGRELEQILVNISHYLQFFSVAFEQMEFEEKADAKWNQSNFLSRYNLKIMCELENMITKLSGFRLDSANVSQSVRIMLKQRLTALAPLWKLMDNENFGDRFKSPLVVLARTNSAAPSDVKLERSVMPLEEREVTNQLERDLRNWLILKDYEKTISYYELVLVSLFT